MAAAWVKKKKAPQMVRVSDKLESTIGGGKGTLFVAPQPSLPVC